MRGVQIIKRSVRAMLDVGPIVLGQVTKADKTQRTVKVVKMELNKSLSMYFNRSTNVFCVDKNNLSKNGDIVLIKKLDKPESVNESYEVNEVIYKIGEQIDPFQDRNYLNILKESSKN